MKINMSLAFVIFVCIGMGSIVWAMFELFNYTKMLRSEIERLRNIQEYDRDDIPKIIEVLSKHGEDIEALSASNDSITNDIQNIKCSIDAFDECERKYRK